MDTDNLTSTECKSPEPSHCPSQEEKEDIKPLKEIGHGSYGKIYKVLYKEKLMAMKYIQKSNTMGVRVLMESYIMSHIKEKYINSSIDIKLDNFGNCQIFQSLALMDVMSFVNKYSVSLPVLKRWIWQLICAIAHLHSRGIIHGDIKASNILLRKEDMVCNLDNLSDVDISLSDFGLSVLILDPIEGTRNYNPQRPSYTPTNRAPEVCKGKSFSYAAEIWALGCTIYEMAYRETLFPLQNRVQEYLSSIDDFCANFTEEGNKIMEKRKIYFRQANIYRNNRWRMKEMSELNNIILSLLKKDEDDRPNIFQIISLPFFSSVRRMEDLPIKMCYPIFDFPLFSHGDNVNKYAKYIKEKYKENGGEIEDENIFSFMAYKILYGSVPPNVLSYTYDMSIKEIEICKKLSFNFYTE
jgi:serine/threonine protein kinase